MFGTRITRLLNIEYPIICGCMQWLTKADLVAAVAEAGGFGILPAATFESIDELKQEIAKTRQLTDKPFGVNVTLIPMGRPFSHTEMVQAAIDEGVAAIETAARNPQEFMDMIRASGAVHMHKCARVRDVIKAAKLGADMVTVVGNECGGHPGRQDISTMVKVARATRAVDIPIAAGGGISDGRGLVAALSLGAEAVVMGTRFFASAECPAHDDVKAALVKADETSTGLALTSFEPVRALRNSVLERVGELEDKGASIAEMYPLVAGRRGLKAYMSGDSDDALIPCGQGVGLIDDIPSVAELMDRIMGDARIAAARVAELASDG